MSINSGKAGKQGLCAELCPLPYTHIYTLKFLSPVKNSKCDYIWKWGLQIGNIQCIIRVGSNSIGLVPLYKEKIRTKTHTEQRPFEDTGKG